jgi:hypothetical protein
MTYVEDIARMARMKKPGQIEEYQRRSKMDRGSS